LGGLCTVWRKKELGFVAVGGWECCDVLPFLLGFRRRGEFMGDLDYYYYVQFLCKGKKKKKKKKEEKNRILHCF